MDLKTGLKQPIPVVLGIAAILGWCFAFYAMSTANRHRTEAEGQIALMQGSQRMVATELEQQRQTAGTLAEIRAAVAKATQERDAAIAATAEEARKQEALRRASEQAVAARDRTLADIAQRIERLQKDEIEARQANKTARDGAADAQKELAEVRVKLTDALDQSNKIATALKDRNSELIQAEADLRAARQGLEAARADLAEARREIEAQKATDKATDKPTDAPK